MPVQSADATSPLPWNWPERLPAAIEVREVGPRDGLQNIDATLTAADKVRLIRAVAAAGVRRIEAASFVSPRAVPQMADAEEVVRAVRDLPDVSIEALVPNGRGAERAIATGAVDRLVFVVAASSTFNERNVRMTTERSARELHRVAGLAGEAGTPLSVVVATAFGCPYAGDVPEETVLSLVSLAVREGADEVSLADTTGMATPASIAALVPVAGSAAGGRPVGLHLHDTRALGMANALTALTLGVTLFDASVAGMGGCPFAPPSARGNISTEDFVHLAHELGVATGLDLSRLVTAARLAEEITGRELPGQIMRAGPRLNAATRA
ncbi:hydroxymethylglutaryl-CoA lyase [Actinomadura sp. 1N219]|uniref:hydroxymethylglutaryl-CoA lyase n=1 Tax=Actinomadura sp. 1N219 TaxID=3375152 RepID=UPI0037AF9BD6